MEHPLKHFRAKRGISRSVLAANVRVSRQTIHRIEEWQQAPSLGLIDRLISFAGKDLRADDFLPRKAKRSVAA